MVRQAEYISNVMRTHGRRLFHRPRGTAEKAYDSQAFRDTLERAKIMDGVLWRVKHRRYPLETWQKWVNAWAAGIRSGVERANATMKRWYGMSRVRYLGLSRNNCHLQFVAMAMNMKRALVLMREA